MEPWTYNIATIREDIKNVGFYARTDSKIGKMVGVVESGDLYKQAERDLGICGTCVRDEKVRAYHSLIRLSS